MMEKIRIFDTAEHLAQVFSAEIIQQIGDARLERRPFNLMLSGGKTPELLYKTIQQLTPAEFKWDHVRFYWGDERCVSHDDPESNFGQARRLWLDKIQIKKEQLNPMYSGLRIEEELKLNEIMLGKAGTFDLVVLGLGDDGHFASVFPDRPELFESQKLCEATIQPATKQQRITVTPDLLKTKAKSVIFLVTGTNKAAIIRKILNNGKGPTEYIPAAELRKTSENITWYLDKPAAVALTQQIHL
jgi:6-phosphogluconolactonase